MRVTKGFRAAIAALALGALGTGAPSASAHPALHPQFSMAAHTSFTRTHDWTIQKTADEHSLTLDPGATATVSYSVTVDSPGTTDSDWAVRDGIVIAAANHYTATAVSARILPDDIPATVDCGNQLPYTGTRLVCSYEATLPDATAPRSTEATVTFDDGSTATGSVSWDFGSAQITEKNACVDVTDTVAGALGTVCSTDALPKTFTYTQTVGPYATCGDYTVDNTASYAAHDTGATGSSSTSIPVHVTCPPPPPPPPPHCKPDDHGGHGGDHGGKGEDHGGKGDGHGHGDDHGGKGDDHDGHGGKNDDGKCKDRGDRHEDGHGGKNCPKDKGGSRW